MDLGARTGADGRSPQRAQSSQRTNTEDDGAGNRGRCGTTNERGGARDARRAERQGIFIGFRNETVKMNSDAHDCCRCSGKMHEGRHDFMARVGNEIVVVKDVPALICDTCGEIEYTLVHLGLNKPNFKQ